jgi:hypothetical protein
MKSQRAILSSFAEVSDHLCSASLRPSMRSRKLVTSEQKMQSLIAKALRTDLNKSVQISMKAVSYKILIAGIYLLYNIRLRELQYESFHSN